MTLMTSPNDLRTAVEDARDNEDDDEEQPEPPVCRPRRAALVGEDVPERQLDRGRSRPDRLVGSRGRSRGRNPPAVAGKGRNRNRLAADTRLACPACCWPGSYGLLGVLTLYLRFPRCGAQWAERSRFCRAVSRHAALCLHCYV